MHMHTHWQTHTHKTWMHVMFLHQSLFFSTDFLLPITFLLSSSHFFSPHLISLSILLTTLHHSRSNTSRSVTPASSKEAWSFLPCPLLTSDQLANLISFLLSSVRTYIRSFIFHYFYSLFLLNYCDLNVDLGFLFFVNYCIFFFDALLLLVPFPLLTSDFFSSTSPIHSVCCRWSVKIKECEHTTDRSSAH